MNNIRVTSDTEQGLPLQGLRVLDISNIIAGPLAATLLADFGAEVVKVELPGNGDPLRAMPPYKDEEALWWKVANRGKKGITLDLGKPAGAAILKKLLPRFDVLIESFRPGTLEKWGLDPEELLEENPQLVVLRVSAFGQKGPYSHKPGFARVADAMSGFQWLCGEPDGPPMHPGYPIADSVTGIFGSIGVLLSLLVRERSAESQGQIVDVSLVDSMFRMMDFLPIEYQQLGRVRQRTGNRNSYAAPGNVYQAKDGRWVTIPASTQSVCERLLNAIGHPDLIRHPNFATNPARVENSKQLEELVAGWVRQYDAVEGCALLEAAGVTAVPVCSIADLFDDPHYQERKMIIEVEDTVLGPVAMPAVAPRLSATPGRVRTSGPALGESNDAIYRDILGMKDAEISRLKEEGII